MEDFERVTFSDKTSLGAQMRGANRRVMLDGTTCGFLDASGAGGHKAVHMGGRFTWLQGDTGSEDGLRREIAFLARKRGLLI